MDIGFADDFFINRCVKNIPYGSKCNIEQYRFLKYCSQNYAIDEWNRWRELNPDCEIFLQGADLRNLFCNNINFDGAYLDYSFFWHTQCKNASFYKSSCRGAYFRMGSCENATFSKTCLDNAYFGWMNCEKACFFLSSCRYAKFSASFLTGAEFTRSDCEFTDFSKSNISGCEFFMIKVNNYTNFYLCSIDNKTIFDATYFYSAIFEPENIVKLEHNIRKQHWENWYGKSLSFRFILTLPVRLFWFLSDYGYSSVRILMLSFLMIILFSLLYYSFPEILGINGKPFAHIDLLTAFIFSLSTMVTFSFSNITVSICDNMPNRLGMIIITMNILFGYFLLALIVTRLSILFTDISPGSKIRQKFYNK